MTSVVIPTHNRGHLIERALDSVFDQTVLPLEVIVVDDGSTDGTAAVLERSRHDSLRVIRLPEQRGANHARNVGIDESRGSYVAFLDSDDEWDPAYLESSLRTFDLDPRPVAVCAGQTILRPGEEPFEAGPRWTDDAFDQLLGLTTQVCIAIVIDRAAMVGVRFDESLPAMDERDFLIQLSARGPLVCAGHHLYLTHSDGIGRVSDPANMLRAAQRYLEKYRSELEERPRVLARHYYGIARWHQRLGNRRGVERSLQLASLADPTDRRLKALGAVARLGPTAAVAGLRGFIRLALVKKSIDQRFRRTTLGESQIA